MSLSRKQIREGLKNLDREISTIIKDSYNKDRVGVEISWRILFDPKEPHQYDITFYADEIKEWCQIGFLEKKAGGLQLCLGDYRLRRFLRDVLSELVWKIDKS